MLFRCFVLLLLACSCRSVFAWSATGHHVISVLAYDLLAPEKQAELMRILSAHPDLAKHFNAPKNVTNQEAIDRWRIGVAGCWPDIIRDTAQDRPTWHYELASSVTIGSVANVPPGSGPTPSSATMATQELYLPQALEVCLSVLHDETQPNAQRAIALCWILHLVADGHQPCHGGSLYAAKIFPTGDRGGNSIKIGPKGNLHSTWDNLLGGSATAADVRRRVFELQSDEQTVQRVTRHKEQYKSNLSAWYASQLWLGESQQAAKRFVYTAPVLEQVNLASRGLIKRIQIDKLPDDYYQLAGTVARIRATQAGYRLADMLSDSLP